MLQVKGKIDESHVVLQTYVVLPILLPNIKSHHITTEQFTNQDADMPYSLGGLIEKNFSFV